MLDVIALVVALASLAGTAALALRLRRLESNQPAQRTEPVPVAPSLPAEKPLQGLHVAICIAQDHPHPLFADLLSDLLAAEDVAEVARVEQAPDHPWDGGPDLAIVGSVQCNSYADVYFTADFTCLAPDQPICTLTQKPAHGDRPSNLAIELVSLLKNEWQRSRSRGERQRAIRELGSA